MGADVRIEVTGGVSDLARDLAAIPIKAGRDMARAVRRNANQGNRLAKANAKVSAGKHGKHYPNAITAEALTPLIWEYGPDVAMPQGGMSFEYGSRNQRPHLDLARSADVQGPKFADDVADLPERWFW